MNTNIKIDFEMSRKKLTRLILKEESLETHK